MITVTQYLKADNQTFSLHEKFQKPFSNCKKQMINCPYCLYIKDIKWYGTVAIGNPERHVRKASHRGSKQQQRSPDKVTLLLLVRATYIYFCPSLTSPS